MNYYFGILLCIAFIIGKIIYEKLLNKQNKIDVNIILKVCLYLSRMFYYSSAHIFQMMNL